MLGMSYFFYEMQRAGPLPPSQRMPWRGDSLKKLGGGNLDDLNGTSYAGGYFDAGDFNKFMLPQAFTIARLAWGLHAFKDAHMKTYFDV
jgi:endoglucanase